MPTLKSCYKAPIPLHGQTSFAGVSRFVPGTSGRIAASQAAKQPKTCDPSYPSLDLVRALPRAGRANSNKSETTTSSVEGVSPSTLLPKLMSSSETTDLTPPRRNKDSGFGELL